MIEKKAEDAAFNRLCEKAKESGASFCKIIPTKDIVLDERVKFKCIVPLCPNYNTNLMCPPYVPSLPEFKKVLKKYRVAILIKLTDKIPKNKVIEGKSNLAEAYSEKGYEAVVAPSAMKLYEVVSKVEALAFQMGYRFAAGLTSGQCRLCKECNLKKGTPFCSKPFMARPSMEALGIDVVETCKRAGAPISFPTKDKIVRVGLVLLC